MPDQVVYEKICFLFLLFRAQTEWWISLSRFQLYICIYESRDYYFLWCLPVCLSVCSILSMTLALISDLEWKSIYMNKWSSIVMWHALFIYFLYFVSLFIKYNTWSTYIFNDLRLMHLITFIRVYYINGFDRAKCHEKKEIKKKNTKNLHLDKTIASNFLRVCVFRFYNTFVYIYNMILFFFIIW